MPRSKFISKLISYSSRVGREVVEDVLREVASERDLLELLFNTMLEGLVATDSEGRVIYANPAAARILGHAHAALLGGRLEELLPAAELKEAFRLAAIERLKAVNRHVELETPLRRLHIQASVLPLEDEENRFSGTLLLFTDITDLVEGEEVRRRSERLETLANLSACMAHEIRNPLNSLGIHIQLLERELRRQGVSLGERDTLPILREEVGRLNGVLENFLSAVRPYRARLIRVSLFEILQSALRLLEPEIVAAGVRVDIFSEHDWPDVAADAEALRRAFINIIRNALEAMPSGGELGIRMERLEERVVLHFEDTGEGIPEEALEKVFEPYFSTKARGSGLGLFMVRNVVEEHRGEIEIHSRPGQGAHVRLDFPVVDPEGGLIPEKTSERAHE